MIKIGEIIELKRSDLRKNENNLPINEITLGDFKATSISLNEMAKAVKITFNDNEQTRELKNRY